MLSDTLLSVDTPYWMVSGTPCVTKGPVLLEINSHEDMLAPEIGLYSKFWGAENPSMHGKYFSLLQKKVFLRCSTIARGYNRLPLPKAVKISAPDASAIYLTSLDLSYKIDVSFTEKEHYAGI